MKTTDQRCKWCGGPLRYSPPSRIASGRGRYCSRACATNGQWRDIQGDERKGDYRTARRPGHPLATGKDHLVSEQRFVLYEKIGPGPHPCHWCGKSLEWMAGRARNTRGAIHVDHLDNNTLNNDPSNLAATCKRCNWGRSRRVPDDQPFIVTKAGHRRRGIRKNCLQCGAEFTCLAADKRPNHGLYCSRTCARKAQHRSK